MKDWCGGPGQHPERLLDVLFRGAANGVRCTYRELANRKTGSGSLTKSRGAGWALLAVSTNRVDLLPDASWGGGFEG
jgi:hypothetical protein